MTIQKTSKRAQAAIETAFNLKRYDLDSYFAGVQVPEERIQSGLAWVLNTHKRAKLSYNQTQGHYCLTVHSNLWYTFQAKTG